LASGCGKSTLLRCFNRLNDLIKSFRAEGKVNYYAQDLYAPEIDPVEVRRQIGMVFQRPNPFPKSIYDNVLFGAKINGYKVTWMNWLRDRCGKRLCGMKSKINSGKVAFRCRVDNNNVVHCLCDRSSARSYPDGRTRLSP
jgi:ABC-type phosphate transport system ATPase subunit